MSSFEAGFGDSLGQARMKEMQAERRSNAREAMSSWQDEARDNFEKAIQQRQQTSNQASSGHGISIFGGGDRANEPRANIQLHKQPPQQDNIFHTDLLHQPTQPRKSPQQRKAEEMAAAYHGGRHDLEILSRSHDQGVLDEENFNPRLAVSKVPDRCESFSPPGASTARAQRERRNQVGGINGGVIGAGAAHEWKTVAANRHDAAIKASIDQRLRENSAHRQTGLY